MPLTEIAKTKVVDWFRKLRDLTENEDFMKFASRGRDFMAMGEIFTEDEEWAKELVSSGVIFNYLGFLCRNFEDFKEDLQNKIKEEIYKHIDEAIESTEENDWLKFHKSIRNMLYETYKLR